jgi:ATP-binding cassette subfamily F protein 3
VGYGVQARLLSQHDAELVDTLSMLGNMNLVNPKLGRTEVMNLLGLFGFKGRDAERQVGTLSGGERRRLLLAMALTGSTNVLLLDEPTNHLDIEGREALEAALNDYDGTVILISHDRALVEGIASRIVVLHEQEVSTIIGDFETARAVLAGEEQLPVSALEKLRSGAKAPAAKPSTPLSSSQKKASAPGGKRTVTASNARDNVGKKRGKGGNRSSDGKRVRRPKTIEMELERCEAELGVVQQKMLDPEVYTSPALSADALEEHSRLERAIAERYEELERALEHHGS